MMLVQQLLILETDDKRFYQEEVYVYSDKVRVTTMLKTTDNVMEAKKFDSFEEASKEANSYGFKVLALNTYLEEVN